MINRSKTEITNSTGKISFANCGIYNGAITALAESMNWEVVPPPKITIETIKKGIRYSTEMVCYPYKITLGNIIEILESGTNNILTYNTRGHCRFTLNLQEGY